MLIAQAAPVAMRQRVDQQPARDIHMVQSAAAAATQYNYDMIKKFTPMALVWGLLGMLAGTYIAAELAFPFLNFDIGEIIFGRLRPVHTSLVIFGFGGSALFATSCYLVQRTSQARLASDRMANATSMVRATRSNCWSNHRGDRVSPR